MTSHCGDDVVARKEQEWRDVVRARFDATAEALKRRDAVIARLSDERLVLEQDFKYNLGLLAGRDSELERFEIKTETLISEALEKTEQLTNVRMKLDDAQHALRRKHLESEDSRHRLEKITDEKDAIIKDLKCQLETEKKKWVEQLESERATFRRQLLKLDGEAGARSAGVEQKHSSVISRQDSQHKTEVETLSACLLREQQGVKQLEKDLHASQVHVVQLESTLADQEIEFKDREVTLKTQLENLKSSLEDRENAVSVGAFRLKETEAKLVERESEMNVIRSKIAPFEIRSESDKSQGTGHASDDNKRCLPSLHSACSAEGGTLKYAAASFDEAESVTQLKQQNFVLREVIKDMKRKVSDAQTKPTTDYALRDQTERDAASVCNECIRTKDLLHRERREMGKENMQLKAKVDSLSCGEYDTEDDNRVKKLEESIGLLKMQMLQGIRDRIQGYECDGNENGVPLGEVRLMLLEEKLDKATNNIGIAVSSDKRELLSEMFNIKKELVARLEETKRRDSEEYRKCGQSDKLKSEEMLEKVRNEIVRLESKFDGLGITRNDLHAVEQRHWNPQLVPERLIASKQLKLNDMQEERDRVYPEVPNFMTDPGFESRLSQMRPVAHPITRHIPRSSFTNVETNKYITAIKKQRVRQLKVRNYNMKDDGSS